MSVTGDGLGNPAYDGEKAIAEAVGYAPVPSVEFLAQPGGENPVPVSARREGAGFLILDTDVWRVVVHEAGRTPDYVRVHFAGEAISPEDAALIGISGS